MKPAKPRVGIFIPCRNEAAIIGETIRTLRTYLESDEFPYEGVIIVVDDGSTDDTFRIARTAGADVLYRHETNRGLGAATRAGMEIAIRQTAASTSDAAPNVVASPAVTPNSRAPAIWMKPYVPAKPTTRPAATISRPRPITRRMMSIPPAP